MKLRFHCDYCDTAHPTADGAQKCEQACRKKFDTQQLDKVEEPNGRTNKE